MPVNQNTWARKCLKCGYRIHWRGPISACPKCPKCFPPAPGAEALDLTGDSDWEEAVRQCTSILDAVDELPSRAEDFGLSVADKVTSIRKWVLEHRDVTEDQQKALDNMESGVNAWLER